MYEDVSLRTRYCGNVYKNKPQWFIILQQVQPRKFTIPSYIAWKNSQGIRSEGMFLKVNYDPERCHTLKSLFSLSG